MHSPPPAFTSAPVRAWCSRSRRLRVTAAAFHLNRDHPGSDHKHRRRFCRVWTPMARTRQSERTSSAPRTRRRQRAGTVTGQSPHVPTLRNRPRRVPAEVGTSAHNAPQHAARARTRCLVVAGESKGGPLCLVPLPRLSAAALWKCRCRSEPGCVQGAEVSLGCMAPRGSQGSLLVWGTATLCPFVPSACAAGVPWGPQGFLELFFGARHPFESPN